MTSTKITSEVELDDKILFLVRIDGKEACFVDDESQAKLAVDSFAAFEQRRLSTSDFKVFRRDLENGRISTISTQSIGYIMNGPITKFVTIDYIPVGHALIINGRLEYSKTNPLEIKINKSSSSSSSYVSSSSTSSED